MTAQEAKAKTRARADGMTVPRGKVMEKIKARAKDGAGTSLRKGRVKVKAKKKAKAKIITTPGKKIMTITTTGRANGQEVDTVVDTIGTSRGITRLSAGAVVKERAAATTIIPPTARATVTKEAATRAGTTITDRTATLNE